MLVRVVGAPPPQSAVVRQQHHGAGGSPDQAAPVQEQRVLVVRVKEPQHLLHLALPDVAQHLRVTRDASRWELLRHGMYLDSCAVARDMIGDTTLQQACMQQDKKNP